MDPFLLLLLALAGGGTLAVGLSAREKRRRRARIWRQSAETCGLTDLTESGRTLWARLRAGGADDLGLTIGEYHRGKYEKGTRIVMRTTDSRLAGVALHAESVVMDLRRMFGASEIEVGDPAFDSQFFISGQPAPSLAFLDDETRGLLLDLKAKCRRLELAQGELRADLSDRSGAVLVATLPGVLYRMLEIGRRWPHHSQTAARIAHNARRDPHIAVRLHNLLVLIREMADDPVAEPTLRAACADPWPEIRLRAATALGTKGLDVLFALAEGPEDDVAAKAIGTLGRWLPPERATAILADAVQTRRTSTAAACIALLGRTGGEKGVVRLARVLAGGGQEELIIAAVEALGWSGRVSAEAPLLTMLCHPLSQVRLAAAAALGRAGTIAAVLPLKEAAEGDHSLRSSVRQSIAGIQSRATGAAPGQLSMTGAEPGRLSLVAGDAGRLSLPTEEAGQLTVTDDEEAQ